MMINKQSLRSAV